MHEVSWMQTIIPEILWMALVQYKYGHRRGVELITSLARTVRSVCSEPPTKMLSAASTYLELREHERQKIIDHVDRRDELDVLRDALEGLGNWYPDFPLSFLLRDAGGPTQVQLTEIKQTLTSLYNRADRDPMMVQATVVWLMFDAEKLKVAPHLALASFPEIERYPETDLSRRIASSVRASTNSFFGSEHEYALASPWPRQFWNRGMAIEPCVIGNASNG